MALITMTVHCAEGLECIKLFLIVMNSSWVISGFFKAF